MSGYPTPEGRKGLPDIFIFNKKGSAVRGPEFLNAGEMSEEWFINGLGCAFFVL
jgi:hypothetical protein